MSENYLIIGDDDYIRERETLKVIEKYFPPGKTDQKELNYSVHLPSDVQNLLSALNTLPFLSEKRLAVLKEAEKLTEDASQAIADYLQKPVKTSVFVISGASSFKDSKACKKLVKLAGMIKADKPSAPEIKRSIMSFFKKNNIEISREAVDLIVELKGTDSAAIKVELEKLISYSDGNKVQARDVEKLVGRSVTETIFKIGDAISDGNAAWAYRILEDLYDQKRTATDIIGYLGWYFRLLRNIKYMTRQKMSPEEIAGEVGYSAGYVKRLSRQSGRHSLTKIDKWLDLLLRTDREIKTGVKKADLAMDMLISSLFKPARAAS